jgi:hypothetical protein
MTLSLFWLLIWNAGAAGLSSAEVALHDTQQDCWLIIDGNVYDVTSFIETHPGGDRILRGCGKDATLLFHQREGKSDHSTQAKNLLQTYYIGALGEEPTKTIEQKTKTIHPHDLREEGPKAGILQTSRVAPAKTIDVSIGHHFATNSEDTRVGFRIGYGINNKLDIHLEDTDGDGVSMISMKYRMMHQNGEQAAPFSLGFQTGMGFSRADDKPSFSGNLIMERNWLDRRLSLRMNGIGGYQIGGSFTSAVGVGMEFRPIPIHGVFVNALVPFPSSSIHWSTGLRFYTSGHHFGLYVASTPSYADLSLTSPVDGLSIGLSIERTFGL